MAEEEHVDDYVSVGPSGQLFQGKLLGKTEGIGTTGTTSSLCAVPLLPGVCCEETERVGM
jgi:hypothetical protein